MLKVSNVSHHINGHKILDDINLNLTSNQIIALIGPNGAGKSTLFSVIARLNDLQTGRVCFEHHGNSYDISKTDNATLSRVVAMLSQENHIQGRLRVEELLMFGRYPYHHGYPSKQDKQKVAQMIERFELTDFAQRFLSDLSGGQKQRVLIAMVVCQDTPFILLDEPLNNLDMYHSGKLMRELKNLAINHHKTVVIVLHDMNQAAQFADTVVMMKQGKVVTQGLPVDVLTKESIKKLYGVDVTVLKHKGRPIVVDMLDE